MEDKKTRSRVCFYCGRRLPMNEFPVKPGHRFRYKVCNECRALGHSCLKKERPKREPKQQLTEEEKRVRKLEYFRRYREQNRERLNAKKREKYVKKKKPDTGMTTCMDCGRTLPDIEFTDSRGRRRHSCRCRDCMDKAKEKRSSWTKHPNDYRYVPAPQPVEKKPRVGCMGCVNYPCFEGFENTETDFALAGCHHYKIRPLA